MLLLFFLNIENIIVMGHSHCAGIKSLLDPSGIGETDFISDWMNAATPARDRTLAQDQSDEPAQHICEKEGVKVQSWSSMVILKIFINY